MTKNIIIAALVLLTACSFVYAQYQETEARKVMQLAQENSQLAIENEKRAIEQMNIAKTSQMEAERQRQIAEECARKK
jgi:cell division protein FtsL